MTTPPPESDPMMDAIAAAVNDAHAGHTDSAVAQLHALWDQIGADGDPLHRVTLAHFLADLYPDPAAALVWDRRALDAADELTDARAQEHHATLRVAGFYPSLHLNIADNLRRLGQFDDAAHHLESARAHIESLSDDPYGTMIRSGIDNCANAVAARDSSSR